MERIRGWLLAGEGDSTSRGIATVRAAVGVVFAVSGAIKFLYPNQGVGRFTRLGIPAPEILGPFAGGVEVVAGILLMAGLLTHLAALPLIADMVVTIAVSKLPLLYGPGPEPVAAPPKTGVWAFLYQARLDGTMLLCCTFLAVAGAGAWSLDAWLARRRQQQALWGRRNRPVVDASLT